MYSANQDVPRELEELIDQATRDEFDAELRRLETLRLLHKTGGINMGEETQSGGKARLLEKRDIPNILEVLFTEEFYRKDPEHIKKHLTRVAQRGLNKYENNLVAQREGKAVGRAIIDTPYPPYSELAGLLVHPKYRGHGVGTELVEGCISLARSYSCNIMYVMTWKDNPSVHRFYRRFGFQPAMLQGFDEGGKEIGLFRFSDTPCFKEFLRDHPLSVLSVSGGKVDFHGKQAYEMKWDDRQTDDFLAFYLEGSRKKSMPRISGIARKENTKAFDAWIAQTASDMTIDKPGEFEVFLQNKGHRKLDLLVDFLLPKGTAVNHKPSNVISSEVEQEASWKLGFKIKQEFDVPALSFYTVLVTCQLQLKGFSSRFPVSTGFEVDR